MAHSRMTGCCGTRLVVLLVLSIHILNCGTAANAASPPPALPSSKHGRKSNRSSVSRIKPQASSPSFLTVILYETEVHKDGEWTGHPRGRWRTQNEEACEAPSQIQPPSGYEWAGDWKIVTSTRDSLGWHYNVDSSIRKRTWLRSITTTAATTTTTSPAAALTGKTKTKKKKKERSVSKTQSGSPWNALAENWNFKGWGWSFYKSLLWRDSCGVSLKLPLSQNLDAWERRPALPSITSSFDVYYPWTIAFFLNMSVNLDYLQHAMTQLHVILKHYGRILVETIWKPIYLIVSTLLLLPTKQDIHTNGRRCLTLSPPTYNMETSERIGVSISWRLSKSRGYEFRLSYWHSYLPTILYLVSLLSLHKQNQQQLQLPGASWLRTKIASLGISTSGPTPDEPHFSCSTLLSLSGFHYKRQGRNKLSMDELHDSDDESFLMTVDQEQQQQQQRIQSARNETDSILSDTEEDGVVGSVAAATTKQQQVAS